MARRLRVGEYVCGLNPLIERISPASLNSYAVRTPGAPAPPVLYSLLLGTRRLSGAATGHPIRGGPRRATGAPGGAEPRGARVRECAN